MKAMMTRLKTAYNGMPFRRRLLMFFLCITLPPLIILGAFTYIQAQTIYSKDRANVMESMVHTVRDSTQDNVVTINRSAEMLVNNTGLSAFFQDSVAEEGYYNVFVNLRDVFDPSIAYTLASDRFVKKVDFYTDSAMAGIRNNIINLSNKNVPQFIQGYRITQYPTWVVKDASLWVLYGYPVVGGIRTIVALEIDLPLFSKDVLINNGQIATSIYQGDDLLLGSLPSATRTVSRAKLTGTGLELRLAFKNSGLAGQSLRSILLVTTILVCLSILGVIILARIFTSQILGVLDTLRGKVHDVTNQNFEVDFHSDQKDELGQLSNDIGLMMENIKRLIVQVYQVRIEKQESEYTALVNQINSHFLYNTLSMINWKAIMIGSEEISTATQQLSTFYRTTLNHGQSEVVLGTELTNVKAYIALQLMLAPDRFVATYAIDETLVDTYVINLLIQPLVENAIEHGFKDEKHDCRIKISVQQTADGDHMLLSVADNGQGMTEEQLSVVMKHENHGYGLRNIDRRVKFYFGEEYGLSIHSTFHEGTVVALKLPILTDPHTMRGENQELPHMQLHDPLEH